MATTTPISYNDKVGLEYVIGKIKIALDNGWVAKDGSKVLSDYNFSKELKDKLDGIADGATRVILDAAVSATSENGVTSKGIANELAKYAALAGAEVTGAVKVPTAAAATNDTTVATTAYVTSAISVALGQVVGIKFDGPYDDYNDLITKVTTGAAGTIYLVKNSGSVPNANDEYFWKDGHYELFGSTAIDLKNYVQFTDLVAITTAEIDKMFTDAGFVFPTTS